MSRSVFRIAALGFTLTLAAVSLTGCGSSSADSGTDSAASGLRLGWTPGPATPQIPLAQKSSDWSGVKTTTYTSGREALEGLLGGGLDVAVLAELPVVTATMRDQGVVVIDELSQYRQLRMIVRKDSGITSFADLKGKKVATTLGTNMQYAASQVFAKAGVTPQVVNVAAPDVVSTLARGDVDAAFMFESFYAGAKRTLGDNYAEIPISPDLYTEHALVVTTEKALKSKSAAMQSLVDGLESGRKEVAAKPEAAQNALSSAIGSALPLADLKTMWADYDYKAKLSASGSLVDLMAKEGAWVRAEKLVQTNQTPDAAMFAAQIDTSFLDKANQ